MPIEKDVYKPKITKEDKEREKEDIKAIKKLAEYLLKSRKNK